MKGRTRAPSRLVGAPRRGASRRRPTLWRRRGAEPHFAPIAGSGGRHRAGIASAGVLREAQRWWSSAARNDGAMPP